jgi:HEAT repeat protein
MALIKRTPIQPAAQEQSETGSAAQEQRRVQRGPGRLLEQLTDHDPQVRRWAIRDLSAFPEAVNPLCEHLKTETVEPVREAIFTTLMTIGGETVIKNLMPLLQSEDPALRNGAIEVLQELPHELETHMESLMDDPDDDVRGFAIDIMMGLRHPNVPNWLVQMLQEEQNINVLTKAVECLAEVGLPEHIPTLEALKDRFPDEPYVPFAVDLTIRRINGVR